MDSKVKLLLQRAENERDLAKALFDLSLNEDIKNKLGLTPDHTFYNAAISHSYYCIFYTARAFLLKEGINVNSPEVHKKAIAEFEKFVENGKLDVLLLKIYKELIVKADTLLEIFKTEKKKRGQYTYQKLPQANLRDAEDSVKNAFIFFKSIYNMINV